MATGAKGAVDVQNGLKKDEKGIIVVCIVLKGALCDGGDSGLLLNRAATDLILR